MSAKAILYDWQWQKLRVSLDFRSIEATEESLRELRIYTSQNPNWSLDRTWRCLNLLAATTMGLCGQLKKVKEDKRKGLEKIKELVVQTRVSLSKRYAAAKIKHNSFSTLSLDHQRRDLIKAKASEPEEFKVVYEDLSRRLKLHSESKHRSELRAYLALMESI